MTKKQKAEINNISLGKAMETLKKYDHSYWRSINNDTPNNEIKTQARRILREYKIPVS